MSKSWDDLSNYRFEFYGFNTLTLHNNSYHICNPNTPESPGFTNIYSSEELERVADQTATFVLNIHLNWDGRALSGDYGFDVANIIRTKLRSRARIIFYSPISAGYFEKKSERKLKYKLLLGRGSGFIETPVVPSELDKLIQDIPLLSSSTLHDVVTMLCDLKGMVLDKLNHNLKFGQNPEPHLNETEPFLNATQKLDVKLDIYREQLKSAYISGDREVFLSTKEEFLSLCGIVLTSKGTEGTVTPIKKHKILLVEDNLEFLEATANYLKDYFVVLAESDAAKAVNLLKADMGNEILAVISDWRLYQDSSETYWQMYQGYEVLEEASKTGRALFALTSQADFVVHQIRNELGFRFQLVKKQDFRTESQKNLLVDWIQNACENNLLMEANIPASDAWKKYKALFLELRGSLEWDAFVLLIFAQADEIWSYILKNGKDGNRINTHFGLSFSKTDLNRNLFPMMVMRLIWFGLWSKYGFSQATIHLELADEDSVFADGFELIWEYISGVEATGQKGADLMNAALKEEDIKGGRMFPHERSWLLKRGLLASTERIEETRNEEVPETDVDEREIRTEFTSELRDELTELRTKMTELAKRLGVDEARRTGQISDDDMVRLRYLIGLEHSHHR